MERSHAACLKPIYFNQILVEKTVRRQHPCDILHMNYLPSKPQQSVLALEPAPPYYSIVRSSNCTALQSTVVHPTRFPPSTFMGSPLGSSRTTHTCGETIHVLYAFATYAHTSLVRYVTHLVLA